MANFKPHDVIIHRDGIVEDKLLIIRVLEVDNYSYTIMSANGYSDQYYIVDIDREYVLNQYYYTVKLFDDDLAELLE